jgi:hypothetical protein
MACLSSLHQRQSPHAHLAPQQVRKRSSSAALGGVPLHQPSASVADDPPRSPPRPQAVGPSPRPPAFPRAPLGPRSPVKVSPVTTAVSRDGRISAAAEAGGGAEAKGATVGLEGTMAKECARRSALGAAATEALEAEVPLARCAAARAGRDAVGGDYCRCGCGSVSLFHSLFSPTSTLSSSISSTLSLFPPFHFFLALFLSLTSCGRTVRRVREQMTGRHGDLAGAFRAMDSDGDGVTQPSRQAALAPRLRCFACAMG